MPRLEWGSAGTRVFETGIDRGVLYVDSQPGVPWIGLTSVQENPSGGEAKAYYIDGEKYLNLSTREEFEATLSAYTYPDEFAVCEGAATVRPGLRLTQQRRKSFGLAYRTRVGNDLQSTNFAYKIHIVYNALAAPASRAYSTMSDNTEAADFSWNLTTKPPAMAGYRRSAHVVIDTRDTHPKKVAQIEDILYGTESDDPRLPTFEEIVAIYDIPLVVTVTDLGNGIFEIEGPDEAITMVDGITAEITWPTVVELDPNTYSISS